MHSFSPNITQAAPSRFLVCSVGPCPSHHYSSCPRKLLRLPALQLLVLTTDKWHQQQPPAKEGAQHQHCLCIAAAYPQAPGRLSSAPPSSQQATSPAVPARGHAGWMRAAPGALMEAVGELPKGFIIFLTPGGLACAKRGRNRAQKRQEKEGQNEKAALPP